MSKEANDYLATRGIPNLLIDNAEYDDIRLSDVLHDYAKIYHIEQNKPPILDIQTRKNHFIVNVNIYQDKYGIELLDQFINYWTEHNEGGRKMRFETHKIFNISKRLGTWHRNDKKFNPRKNESNSRYNVGEQDYHAKLADIGPGLLNK